MAGEPRPYRRSLWRRLLNAVVRPLARCGLAGPHTHLLTVRGRTTGKPWSTPVSIVRNGDESFLVAPYGVRNWVRNARAAGWVELERGRERERFAVEELAPEEAAPILREYYRLFRVTRPFFDLDRDAPVADWVVEASRHPVFRLLPTRS